MKKNQNSNFFKKLTKVKTIGSCLANIPQLDLNYNLFKILLKLYDLLNVFLFSHELPRIMYCKIVFPIIGIHKYIMFYVLSPFQYRNSKKDIFLIYLIICSKIFGIILRNRVFIVTVKLKNKFGNMLSGRNIYWTSAGPKWK